MGCSAVCCALPLRLNLSIRTADDFLILRTALRSTAFLDAIHMVTKTATGRNLQQVNKKITKLVPVKDDIFF